MGRLGLCFWRSWHFSISRFPKLLWRRQPWRIDLATDLLHVGWSQRSRGCGPIRCWGIANMWHWMDIGRTGDKCTPLSLLSREHNCSRCHLYCSSFFSGDFCSWPCLWRVARWIFWCFLELSYPSERPRRCNGLETGVVEFTGCVCIWSPDVGPDILSLLLLLYLWQN